MQNVNMKRCVELMTSDLNFTKLVLTSQYPGGGGIENQYPGGGAL